MRSEAHSSGSSSTSESTLRERSAASVPSMVMLPLSAKRSPLMRWSRVVLPVPFIPNSP